MRKQVNTPAEAELAMQMAGAKANISATTQIRAMQRHGSRVPTIRQEQCLTPAV
jgi:hypothetical protein